MDTSPFTTLPSELRLQIWSAALRQNEALEIKHYTIPPQQFNGVSNSNTTNDNPLNLLQTCRQIHQESGLLFYNVNTFLIKGRNTSHVFANLSAFAQRIGREKAAALRFLILDIGTFNLTSFEEVFSAFSEWTIFLTRLRGQPSDGHVRESSVAACNLTARAAFKFLVPSEKPAEYVFDLEFGRLESSWNENMQRIERLMVDDQQYWERLRPMFDDVLERVRLVESEAVT